MLGRGVTSAHPSPSGPTYALPLSFWPPHSSAHAICRHPSTHGTRTMALQALHSSESHFRHLQQLHQCTCKSTQTSPGPGPSLPRFSCPETQKCSTSLFSWKIQHHPGMLKPGSTTMEWGVHTSCRALERVKFHLNALEDCDVGYNPSISKSVFLWKGISVIRAPIISICIY